MRGTALRAVVLAGVLALASCAAGKPPFMADSDWAIKQKIAAELADYKDLRITVSGGRVYFEGEVPNVTDRDRAIAAAQLTEGVTGVFEELYLTEVGSDGPDPFE